MAQRPTGHETVWSRARNASARLDTKWSANGEELALTCRERTMTRKERRCVARIIRNHHRGLRDERLQDKPDQGKVITANQQIPSIDSNLWPDIVLEKNGEVLLVDVTCPFENGEASLDEARLRKKQKYAPIAAVLRRTYKQVTVHAFIVGSLGSYDPRNDKMMNRLASKKYQKPFRKLCITDPI
ncbi:uncharacterized protein [Procambarus clarkii]|uniref:uncharacterized protein n=1 Tax=Procambarus clarkii TaxID=6728 RepID=UPI003743B654